MDPDVSPRDVEPVGVEGGHVDDVVVVRIAPPGLDLAVADFQSVHVHRVEGPTGRVWEEVDFAAEPGYFGKFRLCHRFLTKCNVFVGTFEKHVFKEQIRRVHGHQQFGAVLLSYQKSDAGYSPPSSE